MANRCCVQKETDTHTWKSEETLKLLKLLFTKIAQTLTSMEHNIQFHSSRCERTNIQIYSYNKSNTFFKTVAVFSINLILFELINLQNFMMLGLFL